MHRSAPLESFTEQLRQQGIRARLRLSLQGEFANLAGFLYGVHIACLT